jgi:hypothetical protein
MELAVLHCNCKVLPQLTEAWLRTLHPKGSLWEPAVRLRSLSAATLQVGGALQWKPCTVGKCLLPKQD